LAWWVSVTPEVVRGVESFGFKDPSPDRILEFVEHYLANYGEMCAMDRWSKCPDDFFVYSHVFIEGGRWQTLEFIVEDTSALVGVLRIVWVEHYPGDLL
jgi:hypothetical protein